MTPRGRVARRPRSEVAAPGSSELVDHLERSERWNGLRVGDRVVVSGLRAGGADWEFRAHVLNRHNGTESIEVVGGRSGNRQVRSFAPSRIFAVAGSRRDGGRGHRLIDRPSLADAPQLPLE